MSLSLNQTFAALADPTRRGIVARLAAGELAVTELAAPFAMSLPAVSKHLTVLTDAGLVTREKRGRRMVCRLSAAPMKAAADWLATYRQFWDERLDALGAYLAEQSSAQSADQSVREKTPWQTPKSPRSASHAPTPRRRRKSSTRGLPRKR